MAFLLESGLASEPRDTNNHRFSVKWAFGNAFDAEDYSIMLGLLLTLLPLGYYSLRSVVKVSLGRKGVIPSFGGLHSTSGGRRRSSSAGESDSLFGSAERLCDAVSVASSVSDDGNYFDVYYSQRNAPDLFEAEDESSYARSSRHGSYAV